MADRQPTHPHELPLAFVNYQTYTQDILLAIANATIGALEIETLPASSSLVFEISNDGNVRAFLNDVEKTLVGCSPGQACSVDKFNKNVKNLSQNVASISCLETSKHLIS